MKKKFKEKPYLSKEAGVFKFDFFYKEGDIKKCYLRISSDSEIFTLRIAGNTEAYGYLLTAALQGREDQLAGYATLLALSMLSMTQDQQFVKDIESAVNNHIDRNLNSGAEQANQVTEAEEAGSQAFMTELAEEISNG